MNNLQFEHIRNPNFIGLVQKLPQNIQRRAAKQIQVLQENPLYPSLQFKMVEAISYDQIFPDHDIDCYGYKYHCEKCGWVSDDVRNEDQEKVREIFCGGKCFELVKAY